MTAQQAYYFHPASEFVRRCSIDVECSIRNENCAANLLQADMQCDITITLASKAFSPVQYFKK